MSDDPAVDKPERKKPNPYLMIGVMLVVLLLLAWPIKKYAFNRPPKPSVPELVDVDPICQYMQKIRMNCVVVPAAETVMGPGHYVKFPAVTAAHPRMPFPDGSLFDDSCAVPGAPAAALRAKMLEELEKQAKDNDLSFDEITYKLDRGFEAGADLPVPKLADLKLKAGPKMSEVQGISLKVPHGYVKIIDENRFINLLAGAAITDKCVDQMIKRQYSVVSKAVVAQNYEIVVTEKAGQSFALSAAVTKGDVTMDAGGDARSAVDETIKQNSAKPVVFGVDFFDPQIFKENRERLVAPIFSPTARTSIQARAFGDAGPLWQTQVTGTLGLALPLDRRGAGASDPRCGAGAPSTIMVTTVLSPAAQRPESRSFDFLTTGAIAGGSSQRLSGLLGCSTLAATVEADVSFDSLVETTVRSAELSTLEIEFANISLGSAEVRDWTGRLMDQKPVEAGQKTGRLSFHLAGAGVYQVHVSGQRRLASRGPGPVPVDERGSFSVSLH